METRRRDKDILSHQFRGQQGGGTSTHVRTMVRERSRVVKIKNIKKQNLLYTERYRKQKL